MFPMMDPEKSKPMDDEEAVRKMASIGAIMEGAGMDFGEDDMRLLSNAFAGSNAYEEQMEALIERYSKDFEPDLSGLEGEDAQAGAEAEDDEDEDRINLNELDFGC